MPLHQASFLLVHIIPLFALLNLVVLVVAVFCSRKHLGSVLTTIDRRTWILLALIFIFALLLRIFVPSHHHRMWNDEFVYMDTAKNILHTGSQADYMRSIGWPFLLSIFFAVFGVAKSVALYGSSVLGALTVVNIFLISFMVSKNKQVALSSALIFSIIPSNITWSASAETNVPSLFIATLTFFFWLLYYQKQEIAVLWLALMSLAFTTLFRPENYVFAAVFVFGLFLFRTRFEFKFSYLAPFLVSLLLALPNFIVVLDWHTSVNFVQDFTDNAMSGQNFGLGNLVGNSLQLGVYFFNTFFHPWLFTVLFLVGILYMSLRQLRESLLLLSWAVALWLAYFSSWFVILGGGFDVALKSRFYMMFYPALVIFACYGILAAQGAVPKRFARTRYALAAAILLLLLVLFIPYLKQPDDTGARLETDLPELVEKNVPRNCTIVAAEPVIMRATTDLQVRSVEEFMAKPVDLGRCYLFIEDATCVDWKGKYSTEQCAAMKTRCSLEPFRIFHYKEKQYTLYRIVSCTSNVIG